MKNLLAITLFIVPILSIFAPGCLKKQSKPITCGVPETKLDTLRIICPDDSESHNADLIPNDLFSPIERDDICGGWMPPDTITPNGNFVKYLISNDSCCLSNLYIVWGNEKVNNVENVQSMRQFHSKMMPYFVGESEDYLFLEGAGSSGTPVNGMNLVALPLKSGENAIWEHNIGYDLESLTIVRTHDAESLVEVYNIRTKKTKKIKFKHHLIGDPSWILDSVSISPRWIYIRVNVIDRKKDVLQEEVSLKNDIW